MSLLKQGSDSPSGNDSAAATAAEINHLGFYVDDMSVVCDAAESEGLEEARPSFGPFVRNYTVPNDFVLEIRFRGFDERIRAQTQLFGLSPDLEPSPTVELDSTANRGVNEAGFIRVAAVEDLPPGRMTRVEVGDRPILVANVDGSFHAWPDRCTHMPYGQLSSGYREGSMVECPVHGSQFDLVTGKALCGPGRGAA